MRQTTQSDARIKHWLLAAIVVGALVRLPGVAWGVNWPDGFTSHHPDESTHVANANAIITPLEPHIEPDYPKAMGAYAAAPFLAWYLVHGHFGGPRVHLPWTVLTGRLISVFFGVAAIWLVFAISRDALGDRRGGVAAAWLLALGGLHVTQSHFFVADIPAATWTLLAVWLLWRDLTLGSRGNNESLRWAAFAAGSAFALKLFVFVFPALAYAALARRPRVIRVTHAAIFVAAAVAISSIGFDGPAQYYRALTAGINNPFTFDRVRGAWLYAIELPSIFSLPLLVAAACGTWSLARRTGIAEPADRRHAVVIFGSVPLVALVLILAKLDHFARHWIVLIPWAAIAGGWWLSRVADWLTTHGRSPAIVLAPILLWMFAFVVDGERYFIFDPRNDAARWLRANVADGTPVFWTWHRAPAGYRSVIWPQGKDGDPEVLVIEMFDANNYLSGVNWRDSYPTDPRQVFDGRSAERVAAVQSLFKGTSRYAEVARFKDAYFMPEYRAAMHLLGDRARSYITEVVVFRRR